MGIPIITAISVIFYILMVLTVLPVVRAIRAMRGIPRDAVRPPSFPLPILGGLMLIGMVSGGWIVANLALGRLAEVMPKLRLLLPSEGAEFVLIGLGTASMLGTLILFLTIVEILSHFFAEHNGAQDRVAWKEKSCDRVLSEENLQNLEGRLSN